MLLDIQNIFSDSQEIASPEVISTNTVRFGKGDVSYVPIIIQIVEDFNNLTALEAKIQTSETEDFSTPIDLMTSSLKLENLKAGEKFPMSYLPKGNQGYMRIVYTTTGTSATTGKITAGVVCADGLTYQDLD